MYLQPIFDSADINKQLPVESKKFKQVDIAWRQVMGRVNANANALAALTQDGNHFFVGFSFEEGTTRKSPSKLYVKILLEGT